MEILRTVERWGVTATVTSLVDGWTTTRQIPYFEINANVQGALHEEAARNVALAIIADILGVSRVSLALPSSPVIASVTVAPIFPSRP